MPSRLFTALVPPQEVTEELEEFLAPRRDADRTLKWTHPESWHITTAFMPAVDDPFGDVADAVASVAAKTAPIDVRLGGAGAFPNPYSAKLLYLAAAPGDSLGRLAADCRRALTHAGATVDGSRFVPHLTLARLRRPIEATKWLRVFDAFGPVSWRATELLLIESHLNDKGARYEVLQREPLIGQRDTASGRRDASLA